MINIVGIVFVVLGILWPVKFPWVPGIPAIIIWLGVLALLSPGIINSWNSKCNKWARVGFLVYVSTLFIYNLYYMGTAHYFPEILSQSVTATLSWLINPLSPLLELILPDKYEIIDQTPYGPFTIRVGINFTRVRVAFVVTILLYVAGGIIVGKYCESRKERKTIPQADR